MTAQITVITLVKSEEYLINYENIERMSGVLHLLIMNIILRTSNMKLFTDIKYTYLEFS